MPYGRASSVKGRCAEILTRSVLACGCAPRAASGFTLDRAQPAGTVPPGDRYTVQCKGRPCAALLPRVVNVRMEKGRGAPLRGESTAVIWGPVPAPKPPRGLPGSGRREMKSKGFICKPGEYILHPAIDSH